MNNQDVHITELPLPGQPRGAGSTQASDQPGVKAAIPSFALAKARFDGIKVKGQEIVDAARKRYAPTALMAASSTSQTAPAATRQPSVLSGWSSVKVSRLSNEFLHACLPLFYDEDHPVRCLGITSAVAGEGKTSVAWLISHALATSSHQAVVLVECDWNRPTFSRDLGLPASPGLAEYLAGTCRSSEVRYQFLPTLTVIPAGQGGPEALSGLARLQHSELYARLAGPDELMILDLPSVLGSNYGVIAARLAETLMLVVRAGDTPAPLVDRACDELKRLRVEGVIVNQVQTRIPNWLQRLL